MRPLTSKQHRFIRRYEEWVDQVVEALLMVVQFYRDGHEEQGDGLLSETMSGFERFGEDNMTMQSIFGQDDTLSSEWEYFQKQVNEAREVPSLNDLNDKIKQVTKHTLPSCQRWHTFVKSALEDG